jgi:hypothetical protein
MAFGNGPRLVTTGLDLLVDAADRQSYPGSGTVWTDLRSGTTGSLTGSVVYTSEFYGGLTFSNSSSAVIFPSTTANYGTGSFTVEMAFKPTFINGRHYLMSKNSGSFPNWAIYLSGSNGSGKLWSEFRPTAAISCSVSSSTTFVTGSVYQVDVRILPGVSASGIYVNGQTEGGVLGNGGGTLANTASLFVGNFSQNNTQNFSGSIYTIKTYLQASTEQPVINYNATSTRFSKPPVPETAKKQYEILVVAGGGSGGRENFPGSGGGGGAGGLQYTTVVNLTSGVNNVIVGAGGVPNNGSSTSTPGDNSSLGSIVAFSGGRGGARFSTAGIGGSGGGGSTINNTLGASGTSGQGNEGSARIDGNNAGGGGGAGAASLGRIGGSGSLIESFAAIGGSPAGWFAGGGSGGSAFDIIAGGIGGGGIGGSPSVLSGTGSVNTGGGGGGGGGGGSSAAAGGSGIVAIRYNGTPIALGGEITQSEGFTYHVFRTVGTSSFTIF